MAMTARTYNLVSGMFGTLLGELGYILEDAHSFILSLVCYRMLAKRLQWFGGEDLFEERHIEDEGEGGSELTYYLVPVGCSWC